MSNVEGIFIASSKGAPTQPTEAVLAVPGRGLQGDRYFRSAGTFKHGSDITLIEAEILETLAALRGHNLQEAMIDSRRNVVTRGVDLHQLVGAEFRIGDVVLRGESLCETCNYFASLSERRTWQDLMNRGGLRASILTEGILQRGATLTVKT